MKKLFVLLALVCSFTFATEVRAQIGVHFNIGLQPLWGPTGYDYVQYYYLPDIDAYYDVPDQEFVYFNGGQWITSPVLPPAYAGFDLYRAHKVVLNEPTPWLHDNIYRDRYVRYRGRFDQPVIRDSRDYRYFENPGHPMHAQWRGRGEIHEEHRGEYGGYRGGGWHGGHEEHGRR